MSAFVIETREIKEAWESFVKYPCGHEYAHRHSTPEPQPMPECPKCRGASAKKEAQALARKQARMIKPLDDDTLPDPKFPETYSVKVRCGGHNLICFYAGKEPGLEAAVEKHWRKHGNNPAYLAMGHYEFKGVAHEVDA